MRERERREEKEIGKTEERTRKLTRELGGSRSGIRKLQEAGRW